MNSKPTKMSGKKSQSLFAPSKLIFYALSLIVFFFAIRYLGKLNDIKQLLLSMNPVWILLALGTQVMTYAFNALILRALLKGQTGTTNFYTLFKISVVIMFVNQVLPTGGVSGNGYVFNQLVKRKVPPQRAFSALIIETICYYIAFLLLLGTYYLLYSANNPDVSSQIKYTTLGGFVFFTVMGVIMFIVSNKRTISFVIDKLSAFKLVKNYVEKLRLPAEGQEAGSATAMLIQYKKGTLLSILYQLCILTCDVFTVLAFIKGFHANMPFNLVAFGFMLTLVVGSLPISPGSLIAYESAMTYFFHLLGLPLQTALVTTLLFRFFTFWLPIPVGLLLYRNLQNPADAYTKDELQVK